MSWGNSLRPMLERVAAQQTSRPPPMNTNVAEIASLDKLKAAIRTLQRQMVEIDTEEHKLLLEYQELQKEFETKGAEIEHRGVEVEARRADLRERIAGMQRQIVDSLKECGIAATTVEPGPPQPPPALPSPTAQPPEGVP